MEKNNRGDVLMLEVDEQQRGRCMIGSTLRGERTEIRNDGDGECDGPDNCENEAENYASEVTLSLAKDHQDPDPESPNLARLRPNDRGMRLR